MREHNRTYTSAEARSLALENILPFVREQEQAFENGAKNKLTPDPQNCRKIAAEIKKIRLNLEARAARARRRIGR